MIIRHYQYDYSEKRADLEKRLKLLVNANSKEDYNFMKLEKAGDIATYVRCRTDLH